MRALYLFVIAALFLSALCLYAGAFVYTLVSGTNRNTKKMMLLK